MARKIFALLMRAPKARAKIIWICSLVDKQLTSIRYLRKKVFLSTFDHFRQFYPIIKYF